MKDKLKTLIGELNQGLVERDEAIKLALLTLLAGENLVLIGPPGTGKSMVARRIADCFKTSAVNDTETKKSNDYFEYLLTKFSTPEEIFGPLSIKSLKEDIFKRNTNGYLPSVRVAFLDEIFKASSSILNALLTILNERIFHNGCEAIEVPLQGLIAASNELPTGQEELSALYDRFLVRCFVDYVQQNNIKHLFDAAPDSSVATRLTIEDLHSIQARAKAVVIPQPIRAIIEKIWLEHRELFKEDRRESLSDRRLRKVLNLLRVSAATNDRTEVDLSDVLLLKDCLWNHQDNAEKVKSLITTILGKHRYQSFTVPDTSHDISSSQDVSICSEPVGSMGQSVKGYRGSGTEQDPLLIESVDQLIGLNRSDVGLKGYYFRQVVDLDISALTTWKPIDFKGHYDGSGLKIIGKIDSATVFEGIEANSSITRLRLDVISLAVKAVKSSITSCSASYCLIVSHTEDCKILNCASGNSLLIGSVLRCVIAQCRSRSVLIGAKDRQVSIASNCKITDCLVELDKKNEVLASVDGGRMFPVSTSAGIAISVDQNSVIERCFVHGSICSFGSMYNFFGFVSTCIGSEIRNCALGSLDNSKNSGKISRRICGGQNAKLQNNISIDTVAFEGVYSNLNGVDGESVSQIAFNQYYFENNLNWDFTNVWVWESIRNAPTLRHVGLNAVNSPISEQNESKLVDVLSSQMTANLWQLGA